MQTINIYSQAHLFELGVFPDADIGNSAAVPLAVLGEIYRADHYSGQQRHSLLSLHALHKFIYLRYTHTCKRDGAHTTAEDGTFAESNSNLRCIFRSNNAAHWPSAFTNVTGQRKQCVQIVHKATGKVEISIQSL